MQQERQEILQDVSQLLMDLLFQVSLLTVQIRILKIVKSLSLREIPLVVLPRQQEAEQLRLSYHFVERFLKTVIRILVVKILEKDLQLLSQLRLRSHSSRDRLSRSLVILKQEALLKVLLLNSLHISLSRIQLLHVQSVKNQF